jgi:hypothetical protein
LNPILKFTSHQTITKSVHTRYASNILWCRHSINQKYCRSFYHTKTNHKPFLLRYIANSLFSLKQEKEEEAIVFSVFSV